MAYETVQHNCATKLETSKFEGSVTVYQKAERLVQCCQWSIAAGPNSDRLDACLTASRTTLHKTVYPDPGLWLQSNIVILYGISNPCETH